MQIIKSHINSSKKVYTPDVLYKTAKFRFIASALSLVVLTMIASYY